MSTVMQTHLQTQFIETTTLTLKLSPPSEKTHTHIEKPNCWNFLESITTPPPKFTPYVHPSTTNKSLSYLISFELCTENLGNESGSDMSDDIVDILSLPPSPVFQTPKLINKGLKKKVVASRSFPPPLTTIRGVNPIRIRSKREGGRLVIDAVEERAVCSYFRSDRSHGRLRLSFWDNSVDEETDQVEEAAATAAVPEEEVEEDIIGNNLEVGVEIGNKKFQRSSRCMEGNNNNSKGLCNWETVWVAT